MTQKAIFAQIYGNWRPNPLDRNALVNSTRINGKAKRESGVVQRRDWLLNTPLGGRLSQEGRAIQ
jgi:hypothetical protein